MTNCSRFILFLTALTFISCSKKTSKKKTVLAIPVYGQSLALGEQAERITDFDSLIIQTHRHVFTENMDTEFGYFSETHLKQWMKKMLHDRHRAFELSIYGMSEVVSRFLEKKGYGDSVVICTFPGGRGATSIVDMGEGSAPYKKFIAEIASAYNIAQDKGWDFVVPAFCWMQGEDDITLKKSTNYKKDLKAFQIALNRDIKAITKQKRDVFCITYQTNCLTLSKEFNANNYSGKETSVPEGQMELIRDDSLFMASGPTYPYNFVQEGIHLDGLSQKRIGYMAGMSVIRLLEGKPAKGLIPEKFTISGDTVIVKFNVPNPPLVLDTISIFKAENYGFSVINSKNSNLIKSVTIKNDEVKLYCKQSPAGSKVRYAVNGLKGKSGFKKGARGNLRDIQGETAIATILGKDYPLSNWCYQFDVLVK